MSPSSTTALAADRVAAAVTGCPAVVRLAAGVPGNPATYLPGRQIDGVAVRPTAGAGPEVEVAVVGRYGPTTGEIAREVTAAVRLVIPGARVLVGIDDLELQPDI